MQSGDTALIKTCEYGSLEIAKLLLEQNARVNIQTIEVIYYILEGIEYIVVNNRYDARQAIGGVDAN